ncbi:replication factor C subunit 1 isoform X1 [Latimeria chalumnae]|uniref:Replication factor C subunit 1 n=1 Tax=Latimeria chalumnae TaxID=7897 RepID=H3A132_LATCH|nr:PREDICTED: replication factor C subunit 1 isoform X1 [Latimeria chalumnae]|eukprot:XP_014353333.1 PREDICTED: replication factor C subunit 1 isoform X1 [Latimeria chalumnae]
MDIRRFFGVVTPGKKSGKEAIEKNGKAKSGEGTSGEKKKKKKKETKVKSISSDEDSSRHKQANKRKRVIYDSDSEPEESPTIRKQQKTTKELPPSSKSVKTQKKESITCVPDTDEEDEFVSMKPSKLKENGVSSSTQLGSRKLTSTKSQVEQKPASPVKRTPTSVLDFFGTGSIQRSEKKLVASKRKVPSGSADDATLEDEALARQLQMEEDAMFERQLHEDQEFARTLAMLDETPKSKKPREKVEEQQPSTSTVVKTSPSKTGKPEVAESDKKIVVADNAKSPGEKREKWKLDSPVKMSQSGLARSQADKVAPSKSSPIKTSSKLVAMKWKEEGEKQESDKRAPPRKEKVVSPVKEEKVSPKKSESISPQDSEKKRVNYQAYRNFLNREGPKALGSKEVPQGAENCLEGLTFVITGVLESFERDDVKSLIERYGGKVTGNVSKKTSYLIKGRDSGKSKVEKAESLGTKVIYEDGLLDLIRTMPGKKSKYEVAAEVELKRSKLKSERTPEKGPSKKAEQQSKKASPPEKEVEQKKSSSPPQQGESSRSGTAEAKRGLSFLREPDDKPSVKAERSADLSKGKTDSLLWVDKYKPTSLKAIIGQQGDQSCVNKLLRWLRDWYKNHSGDQKPVAKFSKFGSKDNGSTCKAALLSGPPGVGKTTTAALVCKELGYSYVELNASDTRSKNSLKEVVAESLNNTSIKGFYSGTSQSVSNEHVLIMDEIDGMAGNEDRGGIQEMISLIKQTKIPIICMCNDRNHQKIRSLVHYCFDLRFQRPRVEQIKGAMMSIAFKEGLKIPPPALNEIILAANQDIRQVLHNLSMWCAKDKALTYDQAKADASKAKKDIKMGPFDVARKVFAAGEETAHMTLVDKLDLFFHDYSLAPLFVQENYLHVKPAAAGGNLKRHLILLSKTADSICDGDLVDRQIRSKQTWSLLPTEAIYASVIPGELMRGYMSQFPNFPSWLGKHSSTGKHDRVTQELATHMSLRTNASKRSINLDYLPYLRDSLVKPMVHRGVDGVRETVEFMDAYCLMKEDVDNIMEISTWRNEPDPFSKLDPKVKAAFTRTYNKEAHLTPYSLHAVKKGKRGAGSALDSDLNEELRGGDVQQQENEEDDNIETDAMIKQKKVKSSKCAKAEKEETSKGKGKGKKTK